MRKREEERYIERERQEAEERARERERERLREERGGRERETERQRERLGEKKSPSRHFFISVGHQFKGGGPSAVFFISAYFLISSIIKKNRKCPALSFGQQTFNSN